MSAFPSVSNDTEILQEFTRLVPVGRGLDGALWLEVCVISWPMPHTPEARWEPFEALPAHAAAAEVEGVQRAALNSAYFGVCQRCNRRCPAGWMHGDDICQSCAERWLEAVY